MKPEEEKGKAEVGRNGNGNFSRRPENTISTLHLYRCTQNMVKGKVFPYSLPSVGPGADPSVQAVSPQMT